MLLTKNITHRYSTENPQMNFPDIQLEKGKQLLILGESGVGKTTLLNILGGIVPLQSGTYQIEKTTLHTLSPQQLDIYRAQNIGIILQESIFVPSISVLHNLELVRGFVKKDLSYYQPKEILDKLNIGQYRNKRPQQLSIGEQQRLNIARAIINKPKVLLADEPTSALDDSHCKKVVDLLIDLSQQNNTSLIVVTHDQRLKDIFPHQIELK